jgi:hypothetical protein
MTNREIKDISNKDHIDEWAEEHGWISKKGLHFDTEFDPIFENWNKLDAHEEEL